MQIDLITLFPDFFTSPLQSGLLGKALAKGIASVNCINPRDFTTDKHHKVDDEPYGGGVGMVLKPEPIFAAIASLPQLPQREVILLTPQGELLSQSLLKTLVTYDQLVLICGHYEGVDERVCSLVTREVSLGDFVLTCGEIPALALINGVIRLLPGTVGKEASLHLDSFTTPLLDYPHYTRPATFQDMAVPSVLLSGNHPAIAQWRTEQQYLRTQQRRPDLWEKWLKQQSETSPELEPETHPQPIDPPA
ncbi:MAG: tRNA (guanosine(37)-N1)-methyltransferase TrmD [Merismopediaceae bacterium]|nr:tRNA (guanosine(37)-N1)-methyltransferase TrmD [Merismopediaceae bacterium]